MKALGIDIGGSAVKGGVVDTRTGKLLGERFAIETPTKVDAAQMCDIITRIAQHFTFRGPIGIGFPGVVQGTTVRTSANLNKCFVDCDLGKLVADATKMRVRVTNDADAAGLAEMRFGAGKGEKGAVLMITLGTGVGTAMFFRGELVPNFEFGHFPMRGKSAEKFIGAAALRLRGLTFKQWGTELGAYLRALEALLWPELFIIGGAVSVEHEKFFKYLNTRARVVPAGFFNEAGIVGAALWGAGKD